MRKKVLIAAVLGALVVAASALGSSVVASATTKVAVTAGKPSELRFKLSRKSVPRGSVVFTVTNRGRSTHDFRIAGKKVKTLRAGQRAKLTVALAKAGKYPYVCTLPGHAAAGMKGVLTVT
jgi:uncharacterized cupredoxin-like copper-binding protein